MSIKNFKIVSVDVEVVDEVVFELQEAQEMAPSSSSATISAKAEHSSETANEIKKVDSDIPQVIKYPLGSVLVHVVVFYESEDNYDVVSMESRKDNSNFQEYELSNIKRNFWTFSACISGHVDLTWQLVRI